MKRTHLFTVEGNTEEDYARETFLNQRTQELFELVNSPPTLTGERRDGDACVRVVGDEDGVHEHGLRELPSSLPCSRYGMLVTTLEDRAAQPTSVSSNSSQGLSGSTHEMSRLAILVGSIDSGER